MNTNLLNLTLAAIVFAATSTARGVLILSQMHVPLTVTFDTTVSGVNNGQFAGAGFSPSPAAGQLDSTAWAVTGWSDGALSFGGTATTGDYARGVDNGTVSTGGMYAFEVAPGNRTLGVQPGGLDWAPGTITLKVHNGTGGTITSLALSYSVYVFNDQGRSSSFNFAHSANGTTFTDVPSLNVTSPEAATGAAWVANNRSTVLQGLSIPSGGDYYFRWLGGDVGGSGNRDQFGFDNLTITPTPEPSTWMTSALTVLLAGGYAVRRARRARSNQPSRR